MDIKQLRELEAKATAGPWEFNGYRYVSTERDYMDGRGSVCQMGDVGATVPDEENGPNGYLIAALRNAAPYLFAVVEAAERLCNPGTLPACMTEQAKHHTAAMNRLDAALSDFRNAK